MKTQIKFGKKIRQLREARKWTQEHLAEATGAVTPRTIQRAENDQTSGSETIQAIAAALDVALDDLKTVRYVPECRLVRTELITTYRQYVHHDETHRCHAQGHLIAAPLTDEGRKTVEDLIARIFADRELIEPEDGSLWQCYIRGIEEPLKELFEMNMAVFTLDAQNDVILRDIGDLKPAQPFVDHWRVRCSLFVPRHGCFRANPSEPLHRFNENCPAAASLLFHTVMERGELGVEVAQNAFVAIGEPDFFRPGLEWCDCCFPRNPDGSRLNFDYLEVVTGLSRAQLYTIWQETFDDDSLVGLS